MIDMIAKVLIFGLLAAAAVANPVGPDEEDDDLPVYTEKVLPGKPTQVPKFGSKKITTAPRKEVEDTEDRRLHSPHSQTSFIPKATLKTTKPVRGSSRPLKRANKIAVAPSVGYNEINPSSGEHGSHPSSFEAAKGLGVEYAPEVEAPSSHEEDVDEYRPRRAHKERAAPLRSHHQESVAPISVHQESVAPARSHHQESAAPARSHHQESVAPARSHHQESVAPLRAHHQESIAPARSHHQESVAPLRAHHQESIAPPRLQHQTSAAPVRVQYRPRPETRRIQNHASSDIGTAVGNAPQIRYAVAPQNFAPASLPVKDAPDYTYAGSSYDEPQPYIFGYELRDENGSTQSRKEQGDDYGNKRGSYGYTDGHGIYRQVDYVADAHGFRAVVKTNEPGTENQNPADVEIHSEAQTY